MRRDIAVIASHWLDTAGGGTGSSSAVPEPSAVLLAGLGTGLLLARRRRGGS